MKKFQLGREDSPSKASEEVRLWWLRPSPFNKGREDSPLRRPSVGPSAGRLAANAQRFAFDYRSILVLTEPYKRKSPQHFAVSFFLFGARGLALTGRLRRKAMRLPCSSYRVLSKNKRPTSKRRSLVFSGREDSNLRYPAPKAGAIAARQRPDALEEYIQLAILGQ